jgi:hypothetical protein
MSTEPPLPGFFKELQIANERFSKMGYLGMGDGKGTTTVDDIPPIPQETIAPFDAPEQFKVFNQPFTIFWPETTRFMVEKIMPNLETKTILQDFPIRVGASAAIPKERGAKANAVIGLAANGQQINFDYSKYDTMTVTPYKTGLRVRFTREFIEDEIVAFAEDQYRRAARRIIMSIDRDIVAVFDFATRKKWTWVPGLRYPKLTKVLDAIPSKEVYRYSLMLNREVNPNLPEGLKVLRSSMIPKNTGYLVQTAFDGCYAPVGYFITKRPLSTDMWPQPVFDSIDVIFTLRYAPVITYPEAIQRLRL